MPAITIIVPTIGLSPLLGECLTRLREAEPESEIVLVSQGAEQVPEAGLADRTLVLPRNLGFAGGCNHALSETGSDCVALVNDDVIVKHGWLATLLKALTSSNAAAVQGVNLQLDRPGVVDGCGVGWNRFWRPVQIGRGLPDPLLTGSREIFGVSATAALYRRSALRDVEIDGLGVFDSRLISYYEDVELSARLRRAGHGSLCVGEAKALHAGSATARQNPREHLRLMASNRYLVLARALGGSFRRSWPALLARDLLELASLTGRLRHREVAGLLAGLARAARELPHFSHEGDGAETLATLERFRLERAASWPPEWRVAEPSTA